MDAIVAPVGAPADEIRAASQPTPALAAAVNAPAPRPRTQRDLRGLLLQLLAIAGAAAVIGWLAHNAATNLEARGVASGFGFLDDSAGFAISEGLVAYSPEDSYARAFVAGLANTLRAALPAVLLATVLGLFAGIAQISRHVLVRSIARVYVDVVRNVPLLVQALIWYFTLTRLLPDPQTPLAIGPAAFLSKGGLAVAVPQMPSALALILVLGSMLLVWLALRAPRHRALAVASALAAAGALWGLLPSGWERPELGTFGATGGATLSPEWLALVGAITLYSGAYCAEIVRAGLEAVPRGQWEAARALSLTRHQTIARVVVPQALRVIVPPYAGLVMRTMKASSLGVAIGYPELVSVATTSLNQNGQAIECIAIIAAVYLSLNLCAALVLGLVNRRVQLKGR